MPSKLRHSRQRCLSREYRVEVVWSSFIISLDRLFIYVYILSTIIFLSLYNSRTLHIYFYFSLFFSKIKLSNHFSIAVFYILIFLMLVYEKLVDTPSINAERMTSVYPSSQWLRPNAQDPLLVFTAYVVLSMGLSRKFTFEFEF